MITFDVAEYYPFTGAGPASLVGKVMLELTGHAFRVGGESPVLLFPDTLYLRAVIERLKRGDYLKKSPFSKHYLPRIYRVTTCDQYGHFSFHDLPALPYIVTAEVTTQDDGSMFTGMLISSIRLQPGINDLVLKNAHPLAPDLQSSYAVGGD